MKATELTMGRESQDVRASPLPTQSLSTGSQGREKANIFLLPWEPVDKLQGCGA